MLRRKAHDSMAKQAQGDIQEMDFKISQSVVYPAHGVGTITAIEKQTVAGMSLEVYVVSFDQDKMILRVPTNRAEASGMRALTASRRGSLSSLSRHRHGLCAERRDPAAVP